MALLMYDGFDYMGDQVGASKWNMYYWYVINTFGRTGTGCLKQWLDGSSYWVQTKQFATNGGAIVGTAFRSAVLGANSFLNISEPNITHLGLTFNALGRLEVRRGSTLLATGTDILSVNSWYYIELKGIIDSVNGAFEVRIDGVADPALTASGLNTRNGGTGIWSLIHMTTPGNGTTYYDDFYLCDTSGAAPHNTFLGPIRIETLYPQTDAVAVGSNQGLTPSTGTDHGALVDEPVPNTTDYNGSATLGAKDTYNYPPTTLTGTIYAVQTNMYVAKSDASARQVCSVLRVGGTDHDGPARSISMTFSHYSEMYPTRPGTGLLWTAADIAILQAGMKIVS